MQATDSNKPRGSLRNRQVGKNVFLLVIAGVVVFLSVRIQPLGSRVQQQRTFDAVAFVDDFFKDSLPSRIEAAPEACMLFSRLASGLDEDWEAMGYQAAIGSRYCFLTRGTGVVEGVEESAVIVKFNGADGSCNVRVATEYVFGNEVRDATGLIRLEDFDDLTTFNQLSQFINERIRAQVLPSFVSEVQLHDSVFVAGACCINKRLMDRDTIELVPIELEIYR